MVQATSTRPLPLHVLCKVCGQFVEGPTTEIYAPSLGRYTDHCPNCAEAQGWRFCDNCHKYIHPDEYIADLSYCEDCTGKLDYVQCEDCNTWADSPTRVYGNDYCDSCYSERFTECNSCSDVIDRDSCYYDDCDNSLCSSCYNDYCNDRDNNHCSGYDAREFSTLGKCANNDDHRAFGVEIETSSCPNADEFEGNYWECKEDGSISGMEFASAKLWGDRGYDAIRNICKFADKNDWETDRQCGLHIHVDMTGESDAFLFDVCDNYAATAEIWRRMVSRDRYNNTYCRGLDWMNDSINRTALPDFSNWISSIWDRYGWLNVTAYRRYNTLELRNHQGTLNADDIINWIKAHIRWIAYCRDNRVPRNLSTREQWGVVVEAIGADLAKVFESRVAPYLSAVPEMATA